MLPENWKQLPTIEDDVEMLIQNHKGDYIILEGFGIVNGLDFHEDKQAYVQIQGGKYRYEDGTAKLVGLYVRGYRQRKWRYLPTYRFAQRYYLINQKEWRKM